MSETKTVEKLRHSAFSISIISLLPHIFCCLIPTAAALVTLGTTAGLGAALASNRIYRLVDAYHVYFLGLAVLTVFVSGIINFIAWRVDRHEHDHLNGCEHDLCIKNSGASKIFLISVGLLVFDVGYYFFEENILGLHHHVN